MKTQAMIISVDPGKKTLGRFAFCIITLASALADGQAPAYLIAMLGVISGVTILTAILGPGVFSCDRLLRRAFIKMEHRRTLKNRARRCSYQALKYAS